MKRYCPRSSIKDKPSKDIRAEMENIVQATYPFEDLKVADKIRTSRETYRRVAQRSTIHGLKELVDDSPKASRIIWSILLIICFTCLFYQVITIILHFLDEPISSTSSTTIPSTFPAMLYCPPFQFHREKLSKLNMSQELLLFTLSKFFYVDIANHPMLSVIRKMNFSDMEIELNYFLVDNNFTSIEDFVNSTRLAVDDVIDFQKYLHYGGFHNVTSTTIINTKDSICYRIAVKQVDLTDSLMSQLWKGTLHLRPDNNGSNQTVMNPFRDMSTRRFHFGRAAYESVFPAGEIEIAIDGHYSIKLEATQYKRLHRRKTPCEFDIARSRQDCLLHCMHRYDRPTVFYRPDCFFMIPGMGGQIPENSTFCSSFVIEDEDWFSGYAMSRLEACQKNCLPKCHEWFYRANVHHLGRLKNASETIKIHFSFLNPVNSLVVEEHYLIQSASLFGSIGGLISLYCGASVLSLAQLFYHCCLKPKEQDSISV